jgi:enamine deaminase RidA (YjgF/YER057c/UK114 family)
MTVYDRLREPGLELPEPRLAAIGVAELPFDAPVEIEVISEIEE